MANDGLLTRTLKILIGRGKKAEEGLRASDLASLQVALMVAALDGKVMPDEFKAFERLAKKCDGATPERIEKAFEAALRSAGYVLLQSFRLSEKALSDVFTEEVIRLLPKSFFAGRPQALRGALTMWLSMAMSDGDYSGIERACLEALFARLRELILERYLAVAEEARERSRTYASDRELREVARERTEEFLPLDFLSRGETALAALARETAVAAEDDIRTLIG